jgi:hypothetical protein
MLKDIENTALRSLLDSAPPYDPAAHLDRTPKKPKDTDQSKIEARVETSDLALSVSVISFLLKEKLLDLSVQTEWIKTGIALKNTHGDAGFEIWHDASAKADGYEGEDDCREKWDGLRPRSDGPRLTIATYISLAQQHGFVLPNKPSAESEGGGLPKGTDPAAFAISLAEEAGDEFWLDQNDKPHVSYQAYLEGGRVALRHVPIASSAYEGVLAQRFFKECGNKVLKADQTRQAISLLEFRATESGIRHKAALRVGEHEGRVYVDLGRIDSRAIEIDGREWREIDEPPVRFVRGSRGEMPIPERGGTLADFQPHFNLNRDDLIKLLGFMIGTFNVGGSYAILCTEGEQGSGKSNLDDKVVGLVDPPRQTKSARMSFTPKEQDLHISALGVHVPYFDNVSTFSADASDALCRLATGGGSSARRLYSDDQESRLVVIRPVIITCIGAPTSRPDLLSRSVRITAQPLGDKRRTERKVMAEFEADRPKLLGFLFSCVSAALRNRTLVEEAVERGDFTLPRLADFGEFVEGAAPLLGLELGEFSALLESEQAAMQKEAVIGRPLVAGLLRYFSRPGSAPLNAYARDILDRLKTTMPNESEWPRANMLRKEFSRMSVGLRTLGIEWEVTEGEGHDNVARFTIKTTSAFKPITLPIDENDDGGGHF